MASHGLAALNHSIRITTWLGRLGVYAGVCTGAVLGGLWSAGALAAPTPVQSVPIPTQPASPATPRTNSETRFSCQIMDGDYTVVYSPMSQPNQMFAWAKPSQLGGGWTEERRCAEISRRLEVYRPDGLLEMRTGVENGYNTVCVTTAANSACRIVLTVPPGQDPAETRDRIFSNLTVADSGQQTSAVNTFTGDDSGGLLNQLGRAIGVDLSRVIGGGDRSHSSSGIDLKPFLDRADGGTGSRLH